MTTCTLVFGKANAFGPHNWSKVAARLHSTASTTSKASDVAHQRELFVNLLSANATRRDAKQYLARFQQNSSALQKASLPSHRSSVKHGTIRGPTRAIAENPQFVRENREEEAIGTPQETLHVALVVLRAPQALDDATLDGLALTLSQLVKLDMRIVLVIDCQDATQSHTARVPDLSRLFNAQAHRLAAALDKHSIAGARIVDGAFEMESAVSLADMMVPNVILGVPKLLLGPLKRSIIPIVPTLAHTPSGQSLISSASNIMLALTIHLAGIPSSSRSTLTDSGSMKTSVDRIIVLDSIGGIPSKARSDEAHVFINLEQELADIKHELSDYSRAISDRGIRTSNVYEQHISNLQMLQDCLSILPSASSALIITPEEVASSSKSMDSTDHTIGTGTRRQKNSLIHNLLTNKPMVSSSLPVARLHSTPSPHDDVGPIHEALRSTLVKRGMPLNIIPDPSRSDGWQPPVTGSSTLDLEHDPQVDLASLTYLIEDSFRRKLDLQHYLARIRGRTAGIIVAGSYDGGAILTWEQPPGTTEPSRLVPYLDKFAVLSSSQGSAGVADILFQAMVRTCFPQGVCWRSRKDNPVNKWYFERADGHLQIPGTNWTMFWTGAGIVENRQRWEDYVAVCSNIEASWKDTKRPG